MIDFLEDHIWLESKEETYEKLEVQSISIDRSTFIKTSILESSFTNVHFADIAFQNCDLSNTKFIDCSFRNCKFYSCKLVGTQFINNHFTNIEIKDSVCKYMNLVDTKIKEFTCQTSDLSHSSFYHLTFKKVFFEDVNMPNMEIDETLLEGIDLSTCKITGLKTNPQCLKGLKINYVQAMELVTLLGVVVVVVE